MQADGKLRPNKSDRCTVTPRDQTKFQTIHSNLKDYAPSPLLADHYNIDLNGMMDKVASAVGTEKVIEEINACFLSVPAAVAWMIEHRSRATILII